MLNESLEDRVSAYTLARHHEAMHGKNPLIVGKYAAWKLSLFRELRGNFH